MKQAKEADYQKFLANVHYPANKYHQRDVVAEQRRGRGQDEPRAGAAGCGDQEADGVAQGGRHHQAVGDGVALRTETARQRRAVVRVITRKIY